MSRADERYRFPEDGPVCTPTRPCGACDLCLDAIGNGIGDREADDDPFLDWHELFTEETPGDEWLFDGVFALGRGHALYATHKEGKSLFVLWASGELATKRDDVDVIYLDYEMTRADVRERLEDMGYDAGSDLTRLHYALLPTLPPLDTAEGMAAVLELVDRVQRRDCHVFVVIDTTGRAAQGKENDADTYRDFYRWTGTALKRRGVTWARLDHAGKDATRGQRGSSGKGDDVDVVWRLIVADGGIKLHRDLARMSWVDETVMFKMTTGPLSYERGHTWPAGTKHLVADLDRLGLPVDISGRKARVALKEAGIKAPNDVLFAAIKYRKMNLGSLQSAPSRKRSTPRADTTEQTMEQTTNPPPTRAEHPTEHNGAVSAVSSSASVSLDTEHYDGTAEPNANGSEPKPLVCLRCGGPPDHPTTTHQPYPIDPHEKF